jgi:hypothetical protein
MRRCSLRHGTFSLRHVGSHGFRLEEGNGTSTRLLRSGSGTVIAFHYVFGAVCALLSGDAATSRPDLLGALYLRGGRYNEYGCRCCFVALARGSSLPPPAYRTVDPPRRGAGVALLGVQGATQPMP